MIFQDAHYVPALRYHWLTRFYDYVLALTVRELAFKSTLVSQAEITPNQQILDLGCGTATLTLLLKKQYPTTDVIGLDGEGQALVIAQAKAQKVQMELHFDKGLSFNLPYSSDSFNRVFSSLLFHHLTYENKEKTLREVYRVLKPNGMLHIADWGRPSNPVMRGLFLWVQLLDGFNTTSGNVQGKLPEMFVQADFNPVIEQRYFNTLFGTLRLYQITKPA